MQRPSIVAVCVLLHAAATKAAESWSETAHNTTSSCTPKGYWQTVTTTITLRPLPQSISPRRIQSSQPKDDPFKDSATGPTQVTESLPPVFWSGCSSTVLGTITITTTVSQAAYNPGPLKTKDGLYDPISPPPVFDAKTTSSAHPSPSDQALPLYPPPVYQRPGDDFLPVLNTPAIVPDPVETSSPTVLAPVDPNKPGGSYVNVPSNPNAPAPVQKPGSPTPIPSSPDHPSSVVYLPVNGASESGADVPPTTISLAPSMEALVVNGQTSQFTKTTDAPGQITQAAVLVIGSQTYTAISGSLFVINGQTLTPGGAITVTPTSSIRTAQISSTTAGLPASPKVSIGSSNRVETAVGGLELLWFGMAGILMLWS